MTREGESMRRTICFHTAKFDVTKEDPNTINPIPGQSLLVWLKEQARGLVDIGTPDCEDWGWYVDIDWKGRPIMLGASAEDIEDPGGTHEWYFQFESRRTLREWLARKPDTLGEECFEYFKAIILSEPAFEIRSIEHGEAR
jgi:hypothetical protein